MVPFHSTNKCSNKTIISVHRIDKVLANVHTWRFEIAFSISFNLLASSSGSVDTNVAADAAIRKSIQLYIVHAAEMQEIIENFTTIRLRT